MGGRGLHFSACLNKPFTYSWDARPRFTLRLSQEEEEGTEDCKDWGKKKNGGNQSEHDKGQLGILSSDLLGREPKAASRRWFRRAAFMVHIHQRFIPRRKITPAEPVTTFNDMSGHNVAARLLRRQLVGVCVRVRLCIHPGTRPVLCVLSCGLYSAKVAY